MVALPLEAPLTTPLEFTVATELLLLLQLPPVVALVNVVVAYLQTSSAPTIGAIVGKGCTVKLVAEVAVPIGVVTVIVPVVAPLGNVAVILVESTTENVAETPLKETSVAPVKFVPVIVTVSSEFAQALVGEKEVMVGGPV